MHLVLILAVLVAMTLAENAPEAPVDNAFIRTIVSFAGLLAIPTLATIFSLSIVREIRHDSLSWSRWLSRFTLGQHIHAVVWLGMVALVSYGLGWPQIVRENLGLKTAILIDDLLILAPVYVPILLSWAAYYEVDLVVEELTIPDDSPEVRLPPRGQYVLMHARHYLALVLLPLLSVLVVHDINKQYFPELSESRHGWVSLALPLAALIVFLPQLLTTLWKTEPLDDCQLRTRLQNVLKSCGLKVRDILVWQTDRRIINAAVSGVWSRMRYVLLTDGLLHQLDDNEIEAVLRHEAGHIARRHLLLRMLMLGLPVAIWFSGHELAPHLFELGSQWLAVCGIAPAWQSGLLIPLVIALYGIFGLGWYCKQLELEADLFACGLLGTAAANNKISATASFVSALEQITAATGSDPGHEGWLHPSIQKRIAHVEDASQDPTKALRFERWMALLAWGIAGGYLLSFCAVALSI